MCHIPLGMRRSRIFRCVLINIIVDKTNKTMFHSKKINLKSFEDQKSANQADLFR